MHLAPVGRFPLEFSSVTLNKFWTFPYEERVSNVGYYFITSCSYVFMNTRIVVLIYLHTFWSPYSPCRTLSGELFWRIRNFLRLIQLLSSYSMVFSVKVSIPHAIRLQNRSTNLSLDWRNLIVKKPCQERHTVSYSITIKRQWKPVNSIGGKNHIVYIRHVVRYGEPVFLDKLKLP